ncbi:hypothetical protein SADUNF_Sadunf09G0133900 [Salix dunnii]|uniref:C2H2-type domain-containing protein n=1 Tax=Salix dunnii TaxID=1413687 RepID=A0A835JTU8_9ROSI|nr:hypothetical protein SADUNF_Sadunf09G0133900 [Salix dunnii]
MTTDPDPDFCLPSSSSIPSTYRHQNQRKKRTRLIKIEQSLLPSSTISRPKYHKKPDPSAPKITRPCSECGKKFWSWKALFGHMRCHPERQWRGINPPPNYRRPVSPIQPVSIVSPTIWEDMMTAEDIEVASCLIMLADSDGVAMLEGNDFGGGVGASSPHQFQDHDQVNCTRFECSSCKKVFGSHQALGGHRASHKNVKGCFALTRSDGCHELVEDHSESGDVYENVEDNNKALLVLGHKCSICLRMFPSGQALGGHMRCHWEKGEGNSSSMNQGLHFLTEKEGCGLDLNLPAPKEDESSSSYSSGLTLDLRLCL